MNLHSIPTEKTTIEKTIAELDYQFPGEYIWTVTDNHLYYDLAREPDHGIPEYNGHQSEVTSLDYWVDCYNRRTQRA